MEREAQAREKKKKRPSIIITPKGTEGEKEIINSSRETEGGEASLSARVVSLLLGDATGQAFENWVALVRKRSGKYRPSGFPHRLPKSETMPCGFLIPSDCHELSIEVDDFGGLDRESDNLPPPDQASELNLWERLGNAAMLDIESGDFSWNGLSSLHHTEHTSSAEYSEDEMNKPMEVTVNSGGVVFFALFNTPEGTDLFPKEAAAVIKIASSRLATQSERLGYEFAKWLGVGTPQARVVHNTSLEWKTIKDAAEKAREAAALLSDEFGEVTCSELLEALEMSKCLLLMNYVHGSPLLENSSAFGSQEAAQNTAAALGRVLMLDLILRNEDRLPCHQLGWRGNASNLLLADKVDKVASAKLDALEEAYNFATRERVLKSIQKKRRAFSVNGRLVCRNPEHPSPGTDADNEVKYQGTDEFLVVAIDTGVPRRPPAGKRVKDEERYPKVVELILNNSEYSSNILYEISGGKLGFPVPETVEPKDSNSSLPEIDMAAVVHEFRGGFRAAFRDLQGFHLFLLTLYQKLDGLLRVFLSIISKTSEESDNVDSGASDSPWHAMSLSFNSPAVANKERFLSEAHADSSDSDTHKSTPKSSSPAYRGSPGSSPPVSRENWSGRHFKGSVEASRSLRMTMKLRDFQKLTKLDADMHKELEQWNDMLKTDVIKFCQENNFTTGFFEGSDSTSVVDAYELKVRLEHILERIALISDAASTERPSLVTGNLFIGGALAAKSVHTLQHLGITHILCLCSNEIGQSDSQYPDLFEYKNFSISDNDDSDISDLFEEASDFIDDVARSGGKVLVHCFEGKSRSATVVLAYLMLRKGLTLLEAWTLLKKVHRRAQPNDGFGKALLDLDKRLHGRASMDWQHKRPAMKVCPICGKNAGLSTSSLKLHLQKSHKQISSGSVDSAMTIEIQKFQEGLKITRTSSDVTPPPKPSHSLHGRLSY